MALWAAQAAAETAAAPATGVAEVVVTAERKPESLQSTAMAVSNLTQAQLIARRIDGGEDLEKAIPNFDYSRTNFGDYSVEIRGVGRQVVGGGGEPGVSINENYVPVAVNHFGDTEFYDTSRVEVSRGPQGTLYGRSATVGAINLITNQPTQSYGGSITGEYGAFNKRKVDGFVNIPLGDKVGLRLAGYGLWRDGVGTNTVTGNKIDGRDLWSGRVTLSFKPTERFRSYVMYEHFDEDDSRNLVGKQFCTPDPGPATVGGFTPTATERGFLSQGCLPGSLDSPAARGAVNTSATIAGIYAQELGLLGGNANAGHALQDDNLHDMASPIDPTYQAKQDLGILNMQWDVADHLTLESISAYNHDQVFFKRDYNRYVAVTPFGATPSPFCLFCITPGVAAIYPGLYHALYPGGVVSDPQIGPSNMPHAYEQGDSNASEWTEELRLSSSFTGPLNVSVGGLYYDQRTYSQFYVFSNPLTALAQAVNAILPGHFFIDPNNPAATSGPQVGHNYFLNTVGARTRSIAAFGELYYTIRPDLKLTLGLRETGDHKYDNPWRNPLLVPGPGGLTPFPPESASTQATTGRAHLAWTPHLSFTDHTMVYGSYSRGYKGGSFNAACVAGPGACGYPAAAEPEYVDAFELGTKNVLDGGRLSINLTGFYYNYTGYQVSTIISQHSINQNIDAHIAGFEWESVWKPVRDLTLNADIGYLHTHITGGAILDQSNLTQGDPNLTLVKAYDGSNCVVNTAALAGYLALLPFAPGGSTPGGQAAAFFGSPLAPKGICGGGGPAALYSYAASEHVQTVTQSGKAVGQGVAANLSGNELPNAPAWTVSFGAQYEWRLPAEWSATLRGDLYWQDSSWARIFNTQLDYLQSWTNLNATLTFDNARLGLSAQLYVKNLTDSQPITSAYLTDAAAGLYSNSFTLDPRTYGVSVTKRW
jgi:outer membrane receptor protein involved in Fe transport